MLTRTLTALLLIPPVVYLIGWSPKWLFVLAVVVAVVLALREYFGLCRASGFKVSPWIGYVAGAVLCVAQTLPATFNSYGVALMFVVLLLLLIPSTFMRSSIDLKDYLSATSGTIFGILYVGLSLSCLVTLRFAFYSFDTGLLSTEETQMFGLSLGSLLILFLFITIWAGDICAYLVGRSMGRTPFFARISPRKTWEGALAGFAGSILAAWAFAHWFLATANLEAVILLSAWIAVAGQVGDLVESAIKRGANQKDSGTLLPGHGGFLDRIDSLLFAAPATLVALATLRIWPDLLRYLLGCFS